MYLYATNQHKALCLMNNSEPSHVSYEEHTRECVSKTVVTNVASVVREAVATSFDW